MYDIKLMDTSEINWLVLQGLVSLTWPELYFKDKNITVLSSLFIQFPDWESFLRQKTAIQRFAISQRIISL